MLLAADYYIEKEDLFIVGEDQKIRLVSLWSYFCLKLCFVLNRLYKKDKKDTILEGLVGHNEQQIFNNWQFNPGEFEAFQSQCKCAIISNKYNFEFEFTCLLQQNYLIASQGEMKQPCFQNHTLYECVPHQPGTLNSRAVHWTICT